MKFVGIVGARGRLALRRHGSTEERTSAGGNGRSERSRGLGEWQHVEAGYRMEGSSEEDKKICV